MSGKPYRLYAVDLKRYDRTVIQASTPDGGALLVPVAKLSARLWQDHLEANSRAARIDENLP